MRLAVIGLWHLGTVTAACTAAAGIATIGIGDDRANVERLGRGEPPVFEPGLAELVVVPLLSRFCENLIWTSAETAEMAKHALNAFLAVSVSFTHELAAICEEVGADAGEIEKALRSDPRIGPAAYVRPGPPFAGGTLARDIRFLSQIAERHGVDAPLIASVIPSNQARHDWALDHLRHRLGTLAGRRIAVLGLAYKPGTDAIRRLPAIELLRALAGASAKVSAFDPEVRSLPAEFEGAVTLAADARSALTGASAAVVATEWPEFATLSEDDFCLDDARPPHYRSWPISPPSHRSRRAP